MIVPLRYVGDSGSGSDCSLVLLFTITGCSNACINFSFMLLTLAMIISQFLLYLSKRRRNI